MDNKQTSGLMKNLEMKARLFVLATVRVLFPGICYRCQLFLRKLKPGLAGLLISTAAIAWNNAHAEHVDVAPIDPEAISEIIQRWAPAPSDPTPGILQQRLAEAVSILAELQETSDKGLTASQLMVLRGVIHQFESLREDVLAMVEQNLASSPDTEEFPFVFVQENDHVRVVKKDEYSRKDAYLAQVEKRFRQIRKSLKSVLRSRGKKRKKRIEEAVALLEGFQGAVQPGKVQPITTPVPTFSQEPVELDEGDPSTQAPPPAYTKSPMAPLNMYAAADGFIYAAAPVTPPEAISCNYASADLAQNTDVQLSQEIRALAEKLEFSPAKIFSYVSNTIKFEPYYGSLKGATGTLVSGSGNATDQASLTIALLRASNIPARYVKGRIQFVNDQRLLDWVGAKTQTAAAKILAAGKIPAWSNGTTTTLSHVWVEACVPYGNYRGAGPDTTGQHWIPLDPSFKSKAYQDGIAINVSFDYATYMASRSFQLPNEFYENQVRDYIRTQPPRFDNNTLDDVGYVGTPVPQKFDILPASLPYEVLRYEAWGASTSAETATLPAEHRYSLRIEVGPGGDQIAMSFAMPDIVLKRIGLGFEQGLSAYTPAQYTTALNNYFDFLIAKYGIYGFAAFNKVGSYTCLPQPAAELRIDGVVKATGPRPPDLYCTEFLLADFGGSYPSSVTAYTRVLLPKQRLKMVLYIGEGTASQKWVNSVSYNNINSTEYQSLQAYAFQPSDRLLAEQAAKLLQTIQDPSGLTVPNDYTDATLGQYLHLVGLKYMRYISDGAKKIGELNGISGWSGNHLGLASSRTDTTNLFDLPFGIKSGGFLIDVPGGQFRGVDITTGEQDWDSFLLAGYTGSAYESYVWQENARMDAVSSVRGIQFAREKGIEVLTLTQANRASQIGKLTTNANAALNYSTKTVNTITSLINGGSTVIIPRSLIEYEGWTGQVYIATKQAADGKMTATFAIGPYAGGYTVAPPVTTWLNPLSDLSTGWETPTAFRNTFTVPPVISSANGFGFTQYNTFGGDPVNMVTGNLYHTETDISIKGRGMSIVFERTYNSMAAIQSDAVDTPLGYGWTHSFNHYLEFSDDNFDTNTDTADSDGLTSSVTWVDGAGSRKFIKVNGGNAGVPIGAGFTPPEGFYFQVNRLSNGRYTLREKNGTVYTFANVAGTVGQKARLESIADRNGNTLTLTYNGSRLDRVTDGLGRFLQFGYSVGADDRIDSIQDWDGRRYEYQYDTSGNLITYRNPLAVAGTQQPVSYTYYATAVNSSVGDQLNHAMKSYTLPRGNGMTFEYYLNGKVFRHTNTNGEALTFTYNDFRREATTVDARGYTQKYFFDEKGNLTQTIEQGGGERSSTYDSANPMNRISETDPMGYQTNYSYDSAGNVTTTTLPSGATTVNSYFNSFNQPGKVKDPNGNYTLYKYDAKGNRTQVIRLKAGIGSAINPATYTPNPADILAWTLTSYDAYGNPTVIKQVRDFATQVGPTLEYSYNDTVNGTTGLNAVTITRCGDRDGGGVISRATECDIATLTYDALGRMTNGIDENWYAIRTDYDAVDRAIRATDAVGNLRDFSFDANGNPTGQQLVLDKSGVPTQLDQTSSRYDLSDRVTKTVDSGGFVTSYQYDAAGNVIQLTNPDGYNLNFTYDANNQVVSASDEEGNTARRTLDISGRIRTLTDPNGNQTTYEYWGAAKEGRLKRQYDALGRYTEFDYDNNGNVTRVTEADSTGFITRTTLTEYDALNRPTRIAGPVYTDSVLGSVRPVTQYRYDNLGNLTTVLAGYTDGSGTNPASDVVTVQETSTFDDLGRRLTRTDPLGNTWQYQYDRYGNVTKITDPKGQIVTRSYLYGGRLDIQTTSRFAGDPAPHVIDYDYNDLGQVIRVTSPEVTYTYQYDAAKRLVAVVDGRGQKALEYRYSPGGRLDAVLDNEGHQTDYLYDPVGRLTGLWAANDDLVTFVRDAGGRITEQQFVNGEATRYRYNADDSLAQLVNLAANRTVISQHDYTYDGFGNRATQADLIRTVTKNTQYTYDPLDRLTGIRDADNANALIEGYDYDPLSRRRSLTTTDGSIRVYVHDAANQLTEIRQTSTTGPILSQFSYDNNGNLINKTEGANTLDLTYDALDRLVQADIDGSPAETYAYDPQGRRIEKNENGSLTRYRYDGDTIYAEYGTDWTQANTLYTHGAGIDDVLIREDIPTGNALHYQQDGLGSIVSVTDMAGTVQGTARYDAWGNTTQATGTIPRYGYTGREPDATGLIYYRARYYDPTIGRFTQRDPKGFIDGINQYAYAINNPINYTDPRGTSVSARQFNNFAQNNTYYSRNIPTGNAAAAYYNRITPQRSSLARTAVNVGASLLPFGTAISQVAQGNYGQALVSAATDAVALAVTGGIGYFAIKGVKAYRGVRAVRATNSTLSIPRSVGARAVTTRVRHFTNKSSLGKIERDRVINAGDKGCVFCVSANRRALSPRDTEAALGIKRGRGNAFVEFDAGVGEFDDVVNSLTGAREFIFRGNVNLNGRNATFNLNR